MSGFLSLYSGTVVLDAVTGKVVEDGAADRPEWWVEVQKTLAQGDFEKAQRFLVGDMGVEARADAPDDAMLRQKSDLIGYQRELVMAALVEWNLTDENGSRLPIANLEDRRRSISLLPPQAFTAIFSVVRDLNQPAPAEEKARFRLGSDAGAQNGGETAADHEPVLDRGGALEEARA